jgi:hypothetical protein
MNSRVKAIVEEAQLLGHTTFVGVSRQKIYDICRIPNKYAVRHGKDNTQGSSSLDDIMNKGEPGPDGYTNYCQTLTNACGTPPLTSRSSFNP